jgi:hypothetical protein
VIEELQYKPKFYSRTLSSRFLVRYTYRGKRKKEWMATWTGITRFGKKEFYEARDKFRGVGKVEDETGKMM